MSERVLVAGIGNVFHADDGFGPAVARKLLREGPPSGVRVVDFGIRGLHLAYELLEPLDRLIVVDTVAREAEPGTLFVIEPDLEGLDGGPPDAHGMHLPAVFAQVDLLGGAIPPAWIVGCTPLELEERLGLSLPVQRAVDLAASWVRELVARERRAAVEQSLEVFR